MDVTANLRLPYILPAQAQKHVTHNEAIRMLDAVSQAGVLDRDLSAPPPAPAEGDRYIVAAGAGGGWTGRDHALAAWQDGAWAFYDPRPGWLVWVADENLLVVWSGTAWVQASVGGPGGGVTPASLGDGSHGLVGVNGAAADATNRLSVRTPAALFDAVDVAEGGAGDCRIVVNKEAAADTASHLFQTGFSGRAEFGLTGDDDFRIKVSADGSSWTEALFIDKDNGRIGVNTFSPQERFDIRGTIIVCDSEVDNLNKGMRFGTLHYDVQEQPAATIVAFTSNAANLVLFGGGTATMNAATEISFYTAADNTTVTGASRMKVTSDGSIVIGAPAGGGKGAGTLNAEGVYDDNTLLSCYIFDQAIEGRVDVSKWDAKVPDRVTPEEIDYDTGERRAPPRVEKRDHGPLRKFVARLGTAHDPLTLDGYARHWKEKRHLTAMPNEAHFDPDRGMSAGEWIQRLVETAEIQAVLIEALNQKVKDITHTDGKGLRR